MVIPQFVVSFVIVTFEDGERVADWLVVGEEKLDALCETLRWNGMCRYSVRPFDPMRDTDPRVSLQQSV